MNLHDKIMAIPPSRTDSQGYLLGHRDARHAAAELAVKHDALVAQLVEALADMAGGWAYIRGFHGDLYGVGWDRAQSKADAALAAARGEVVE